MHDASTHIGILISVSVCLALIAHGLQVPHQHVIGGSHHHHVLHQHLPAGPVSQVHYQAEDFHAMSEEKFLLLLLAIIGGASWYLIHLSQALRVPLLYATRRNGEVITRPHYLVLMFARGVLHPKLF